MAAAVFFLVAGGLLVWRSSVGVGIGYAFLAIAVMDLILAGIQFRRERGSSRGDRQPY